jgi:ABC-type antimicrobial peptide transport system permease subunit
LLLSARHFQRLFPSRAGFGFFLIDAPPGEAVMVRQTLEGFLGESFGFHVTSAAERLASFQAVENTYLSTFQALGGIGLLLGVVGLAIVLLRNFQERLGEWALLQALGYARRDLGWLALVEQGMLLMLGMSVGLVSALVAVGPLWATQAGQLPWRQMLLLAVLLPLVGGLAGMAALWSVLRVPLLAALRR